jgi:hypothetical protein
VRLVARGETFTQLLSSSAWEGEQRAGVEELAARLADQLAERGPDHLAQGGPADPQPLGQLTLGRQPRWGQQRTAHYTCPD